jgi:hypothetical protein
LALLVVAVATLPVTWLVLHDPGKAAGTPRPPSLDVLPYTLFAYAAGYSLGPTVESLHALPSLLAVARAHPSVVVVTIVFGLAAAAGCRRLWRSTLAAPVVLPLLAVPPLGVLVLSYATPIVYNVRYALPALIAFLVVVAAGCTAPRRPAMRLLASSAVLAFTLVAVANFYAEPRYDKADARAAMAAIRAGGEPAHVIVTGDVARVVDYYTRGTGITWQRGCTAIAAAGSAGTALWVAAGRDWQHAGAACLDRLGATYRVVASRRFVGFELWRLAATEGG